MMLKNVPSDAELFRLYFELQKIGAPCVGERKKWPYGEPDLTKLLILASEMLRYDPRLMTILVLYCLNNFQKINPTIIRSNYSSMTTPQVWAVIAEFLLSTATNDELIFWARYLQEGLTPVPLQFFYHYIYHPGGILSERAIEASLAEYKKWGFLACENPVIDTLSKKTAGSLDRVGRINVLTRLVQDRKEISIGDYLCALNHSISRQQALADMKGIKFLRQVGKGRGARWRIKSKSALKSH